MKENEKRFSKVALTVAGFDGSGGAGIVADIKTFTALGVYALSVITSLTVQNTKGVVSVHHVSSQTVDYQIKTLWEDFNIEGVKVGMIGSTEIANVLADAFEELKVKNLVIDPVLVSSSGKRLLEEEGMEVLKKRLIPLADVITPNINEAEVLCGIKIKSLRDVEECARKLFDMGARSVVIKGGHIEGEKAVDVFFEGEEEIHYFVKEKLKNISVHGTGCTFASAVCAFLVKGFERKEAILRAKEYTYNAILASLKLGKGANLPNHFWCSELCG